MSYRHRDRPPFSAWLVAERSKRSWKAEEVARRLRELGYQAEDSTYRTWEAGRRPAADTVAALERLFESAAPGDGDASGEVQQLIGAMTAALLAQTQALIDLRTELADVRQLGEDQREAMAELIGGLARQLRDIQGRAGMPGESAAPRSGDQ